MTVITKSNEYYISKCRETHGDKYNYSKFNFITSSKKVIIICSIHGDFEQLVHGHINGSKCPKCSGCFRYNTVTIKENFKTVHGDRYDYSKVIYKNDNTKVCIVCPIHGDFLQKPTYHKLGRGCPECGLIKKAISRKIPKVKVIKDFKLVHGNRYDYSKSEIDKMVDKIEIICKNHGSFWQAPITHKQGVGCPDCATESRHGHGLTKYIKLSKDKYKGISYLYLIKCSNNNEVFYKVGISVRGVKGRYCGKKTMPYNFEILYNIPLPVKQAWDLETTICRSLKDFHYTPSVAFGGSIKECFSDITDEVLELFNLSTGVKDPDA